MTKNVILLALMFLATTLGVASAAEPERRVIRPADSVWDDAASLAANRGLSPTAQRRQAFQNPGAMDSQQLTRGFQEATQPLTDAGQQAAQYLQEGTRSVLDQTGQALERLDPTSNSYNEQPAYGGQQQAYGTRPNYGGTTAQPSQQQRAQQPQSTLPENPRYVPYSPPVYDPNRDLVDNRGPALPQPNPEYQQQRGLAESFTSNNDNLVRSGNSRTEPIRRRLTSSQPRDDFDAFDEGQRSYPRETAGRDRTVGSDRSGYPSQQDDYGRRSADDDFPAMPDRRQSSSWDDTYARGQSPTTTSADRFPTPRVDNTGFAAGGTAAGDIGVAGWIGSPPGNPVNANPANGNGTANTNLNQAGVVNAGNNSPWDMDRFLLVVLTAICCYVVIAHLDLRNRYRAALRGAPAGYGNPLSEI